MSDAIVEKDKGSAHVETKSDSLAAFTGIGGTQEWRSFDAATKEGAKMLLQATLGKCRQLKDYVNKVIHVTHVYAHGVETVDEDTGVVQHWNRIVLWDANGDAYDCGSLGVAKSIGLMVQCKGLPPFDPPVAFTVKLRSLEGRKQWLYLEPDLDKLFV